MGRAHEVRAASMAKTAAAKSKLNNKYSRTIYMAAKSGIPDPELNLALKHEIEKAKREQVNADTIKRAIEKAKGGSTENYYPIRYEGFGPKKDKDTRRDRKHDAHVLPAKCIDLGLISAKKF